MKFQFSALAIVMTLAACGGDNPPAATPPPVESAAPTASAAASAAPVETPPPVAKTEEPAAKHEEPPPAPKTIVDVAAANSEFSTLMTAIKEAGLEDSLKGAGPFTVFAPTDEAFKKLPKGKLEKLLKDKKALTKLLQGHVVEGKLTAADVAKAKTAKTLAGGKLTFKVAKDGAVSIGKSKVSKTDIEGSNGVIHVVDTVIQ